MRILNGLKFERKKILWLMLLVFQAIQSVIGCLYLKHPFWLLGFSLISRISVKGLSNSPNLYFYRDSHGNEVDLVYQHESKLWPIEIKSSQTWHASFIKGA